MKTNRIAALMTCALGYACGSAAPAPRETVNERLNDGSLLRCVADDVVGLWGIPAEGRTYSGALDRMPSGHEFRALYRVVDDPMPGATRPMTAIVLFGHTIPRFDQIHFPASVPATSLTFLRTEPSVFMLFQLDPWDGETARFSWVERRHRESYMAHGQCALEQ